MGGLDAFYSPRSVVVLGASRRPGKLGHDVMVECARLGFSGAMYGVNPLADGEPVGGWPVVRSVRDLPEVPDLAFVALPASGTL
ncbi:MAG: CoA-binding protein, partial [Actinomycetota bacterium]|nr:CoA-binding protein [Actinomycetota bacterium]